MRVEPSTNAQQTAEKEQDDFKLSIDFQDFSNRTQHLTNQMIHFAQRRVNLTNQSSRNCELQVIVFGVQGDDLAGNRLARFQP